MINYQHVCLYSQEETLSIGSFSNGHMHNMCVHIYVCDAFHNVLHYLVTWSARQMGWFMQVTTQHAGAGGMLHCVRHCTVHTLLRPIVMRHQAVKIKPVVLINHLRIITKKNG